jgi:hypothetical protein
MSLLVRGHHNVNAAIIAKIGGKNCSRAMKLRCVRISSGSESFVRVKNDNSPRKCSCNTTCQQVLSAACWQRDKTRTIIVNRSSSRAVIRNSIREHAMSCCLCRLEPGDAQVREDVLLRASLHRAGMLATCRSRCATKKTRSAAAARTRTWQPDGMRRHSAARTFEKRVRAFFWDGLDDPHCHLSQVVLSRRGCIVQA